MTNRDRDYGAALPNQLKDGATIRIAKGLMERQRKFADKIPGGLADESSPSEFESKELELGIQEELEHTNDPMIAKEIAMDHMTEDPHYYSKMAVRVASRNEVPENFDALGANIYKRGHQIWELQQFNNPDSQFRLIRKHHERFSDMMDRDLDDMSFGASQRTASKDDEKDDDDTQASEEYACKVGCKVETIRDGRIAQGIILVIEESDDTADVEYEDGEVEHGCPLEMLSPLGMPGMPMLEIVTMEPGMEEGGESEGEEKEEEEDEKEGTSEKSSPFEPGSDKEAMLWAEDLIKSARKK